MAGAHDVAMDAVADDRGDGIHPLWLRLIHWANAVAVVILMMSGWRIYDATHFMFGLVIPNDPHKLDLTLGHWLGGAIQWHFAAMWLLFGNAILYCVMSIATRRFGRQFLPVGPKGLWADLKAFAAGHLSHADIRQYNTIQKLAYLFAMFDIIVLILSGLVLWKSVQLPWLRMALGGYELCRRIHFLAMAGMFGFAIVHVVMAVAVPRTIKAMLWGR